MLKQLAKKALMAWYSIRTRTNFTRGDVFAANCPFVSRKNRVVLNGKRIYIGHNCHFGADVEIGDHVLIASNVSFVGGDHRIDRVGVPVFDSGPDELKAVHIGDDAWIGHGAIIMQGASIGFGAVVAAGSVVTKPVPDFAVVAGAPAKIIRQRFDESDQQRHRDAVAALRNS